MRKEATKDLKMKEMVIKFQNEIAEIKDGTKKRMCGVLLPFVRVNKDLIF